MPRFSRVLALSPLAFLVVSSCGVICIPEPPYMLSNICVRFPRELCAVRHRACEESGVGFDAELCQARVLASCDANVEAVHRNEMTFDADEVKACLVSLSPQSNAAITDLHAALVGKGPCARIFQGKLGPLDRCERDEQCAQPEPRDEIARCNRDQRCEVVRVLRAGESCTLDNEGNHRCAAGLACQLPITEGDPDIGTCVEQLELGARCNPINDRLRCGREATCDGETQVCVPRRPMGSRCFSGADCLSGHCIDELCGPNTTLFTPVECGQTCLGNLCDLPLYWGSCSPGQHRVADAMTRFLRCQRFHRRPQSPTPVQNLGPRTTSVLVSLTKSALAAIRVAKRQVSASTLVSAKRS